MDNNNILKHAENIIYHRTEEQERKYGPMDEMIERTAHFASSMSKSEITPEQVFCVLIGLKLTRESHAHRYDNILDALAYLAAYHEYVENKNPPDLRVEFNKAFTNTFIKGKGTTISNNETD